MESGAGVTRIAKKESLKQVVNADVFEAGDWPASESLELGTIKEAERTDARLLNDPVHRDLNGSRKPFCCLECQFVDVVSDLKK